MTLAPPLVLDNGTSSIKCGCAGVSPLPLLVCPTVVGYPSARASAVTTTLSSATSSGASQAATCCRDALRTRTSPYAPLCTSSAALDSALSVADSAAAAQLLLRRDVICGDDLAVVRGALSLHHQQQDSLQLTYPMRNGVIQNMSAMQQLWDHTLGVQLPYFLHRRLGTSGGDGGAAAAACAPVAAEGEADGAAGLRGRRLLLCEPPNLSRRQRTDVLECFFESYALANLQTAPQGVLALFANGAESGVVVECGEGLGHCTPIFDGYVLTQAQRRTGVAGHAVSERLGQLLDEQGHQAQPSSQQHWSPLLGTVPLRLRDNVEVLRRVKERYCYVACDAVHGGTGSSSSSSIRGTSCCADARLARETNTLHCTCVLPDGSQLRLGAERFTAPEVLFHPQQNDVYDEGDGVADALWHAIEATDIDVRAALYGNIIVSGGTTLLPGFASRLEREMRCRYLTEKAKGDGSRMARCPISVKAAPRRQHMVYMGGALMAELTQDQPERWLSRSMYEECGASPCFPHPETVSA